MAYRVVIIPAIPKAQKDLKKALNNAVLPGYQLVSWTVDSTDTGPRILLAIEKQKSSNS